MGRRVRTLWSGAMPLKRAFWDYAIVGGFLINLAATIGSMGLIAANAAAALSLIVHLLPVPYNFLMLVAVWRSAGAYAAAWPERRLWAYMAKATIIPWTLAASLL